MIKGAMTNVQGVAIVVLFMIGSAVVLSPGGAAKQDVWITILLSMLMAVPFVFIYARILQLFPEKDLFEILRELYGNIISKIIALLFIWYAFHLGALVLRNFSEFITTVSLPETPQPVIIVSIGIICIWLVKCGKEIMGQWTGMLFPLLLVAIITQVVLSMTQADFDNLKPVMYNGIQPLIGSAFAAFSFLFAETVILTMIFSWIKNRFNTYKVYYLGLFVGGIILLLAAVRNILVLGAEDASLEYFPSYEAVSVVNIANFFQRIEVIVTIIFMLTGIVKISACLFAASKGLAFVLNFKNYKAIVVPVGLLMMNLACIVYKNTMEMFEWALNIYMYYAIPFQIILPLLIWIFAEIKSRGAKKKEISTI